MEATEGLREQLNEAISEYVHAAEDLMREVPTNGAVARWRTAMTELEAVIDTVFTPPLSSLWKSLSDVQWANIVNHDHSYDTWSKDDAVNEAVKRTEAKLRELNAKPAPSDLTAPAGLDEREQLIWYMGRNAALEGNARSQAQGDPVARTWNEVKDELPPFGKYVLARHNRGTWIDSTDQDNVNCVVVKRVLDTVQGNNLTPYSWREFGPDKFFGQTITHWMEIPASNSCLPIAEQ